MAVSGIALGTSDAAAAGLRGGRPVIMPSAEGISRGGKAFPSDVALTADGQRFVDAAARRQAAANPEGTATAFMGRRSWQPRHVMTTRFWRSRVMRTSRRSRTPFGPSPSSITLTATQRLTPRRR